LIWGKRIKRASSALPIDTIRKQMNVNIKVLMCDEL